MKTKIIKFKNSNKSYSIFIGHDILKILPNKIKLLCPKTKKLRLFLMMVFPINLKKKFLSV